jgi:two-component system, OmpR family, phosphate regulon sensor histidine kinase PhoR
MSGTDWLVALAVVAGVAATSGFVVRRSLARHRAALEERLRTAEDELRRRERSSAEERAVQDLILSSMRDGVLLIGPNGATAYANAALTRHLGSRPASTAALFPLALREAVEGAAHEKTTASALLEVGSPSRWLRIQATPAGDDGSVLVVVRDVTEARRLDEIRRDFVANASHELKTPAASIQAAAETLRDAAEDDPAAVPRFAAQLEREAVRLSRIVADLLDLSRLESGSELGDRVHLDSLAREEAQRFEEQAQRAEVRLTVDAPDPTPVRGSSRDLSLLIRNLVDNAIRYTHPGDEVRVEVGAGPSGSTVLRVTDTGAGIPQRDLPRVFERFYRVDRARSRETGGTGLGLAIVKHVTENHGGSVQVSSELGRGTTFEVHLPRDQRPEEGRSPHP